MIGVVLLSSAFIVVTIILCILLVFYVKKVSDYRNTYYVEEITKLREEISELKKIIVNELKEQLNKVFK